MNGKLSRVGFGLLVCTLLTAGIACRREPLHTGDLDEVRSAGELRVVVRPGFFSSPAQITGGVKERELLQHLAGRLGVQLRWVQAKRNDQVVPWLLEGRADLAALRFSPAGLRMAGAVPSAAVDWVEDLVVASRQSNVRAIEDLPEQRIFVQRSFQEWVLGGTLGVDVGEVVPVPEEVSYEEILDRVRHGRYPVSVMDSGLVEALEKRSDLVEVGPVAEPRPLVWGMRPDAPSLRAAVDDFLFAETVLSQGSVTAACRDLAEVRRAHVLRLVTVNSPTTCTVDKGGLQGFEYDLAVSFARFLGVRLELRIPPPGTDPLAWLEQGYGDLAALHEPLTPDVSRRFPVAGPYWRTDLVAVSRREADPPAQVSDLAGAQVVAAGGVARIARLFPIEPAPVIQELGSGSDSLAALVEVESGGAGVAIVDADTARLELPNRPALRLGPVVVPEIEIGWIVAPGAQDLQRAATRFLKQTRRSGLIRQLARTELWPGRRYVSRSVPPIPPGDLTPYDRLLQVAAADNRLDWRLLASLMYEESRFDPDAVGPGGSSGLFQFMPMTWRELGVNDPHAPEEAIPAAARYLRRLMDDVPPMALADRVAMAVASYNVGPRHVADARRLTRQMGLDPGRWRDNVETAMLLLDNPEVARRFPAGVCRCRRAAGYTRRILRRYRAYREQFPPSAGRGL